MRAGRCIALLAILSTACAPGLTLVTPAQVEVARQSWPDSEAYELRRGRRLYIDRCSSCHSLYPPETRTDEQWASALDEMGERARLSWRDREVIRRFLLSARRASGRTATDSAPD